MVYVTFFFKLEQVVAHLISAAFLCLVLQGMF